MRYSPEALTAFVEAVDSGSFSAAARRLRKSQSTISTAIANLEADLGVTLFDRATRQPTLTPQGEQVLSYVKAILAASERLDELAVSLSGETEPRLTFVLSDTLHPDVLEDLLVQFDRRFPHTEFECLIGEDEDVIDLLQKSRAQVGLIEARERYPTDIGSTRLPLQTAMGIYVAPDHPLAGQGVNLGYRDVDALIDVLVNARSYGEAWASYPVLKRYQMRRMADNFIMQSGMDLFYAGFSNNLPPLRFMRNLGLMAAERAGVLKRQALKYALGL